MRAWAQSSGDESEEFVLSLWDLGIELGSRGLVPRALSMHHIPDPTHI